MKTTLGLILLLFATLFSCIRQEKTLPVELSRAESVMWEYPDSLNIRSSDELIQNTMDSFEKGGNHAKKLAEVQVKYDHERLLNITKDRKNESTGNRFVCHFRSVDSYYRISISCIAEGKIFSVCQRRNTNFLTL